MAPVAFISPRISAIVPARNEEEVIAVCVASLTQQEEIFEVIVVDDQSSDRTAKIVAGLMAKNPQVRLLKTEESAGRLGWQEQRGVDGSAGRNGRLVTVYGCGCDTQCEVGEESAGDCEGIRRGISVVSRRNR